MTVSELKRAIYEIAKRYFCTANVIWAGQKRVKPASALVTLRQIALEKNVFPVESIGGEDVFLQAYACRMHLEVQLYISGTPKSAEGMTYVPDNAAVNGLSDFVNFIGSEYVKKLSREKDICILPEGNVQDLSALVEDVSREYRAMQQFTVDFTEGATGISGAYAFGDEWKPTDSGGGSKELASTDVGYFVEAEIEKKG